MRRIAGFVLIVTVLGIVLIAAMLGWANVGNHDVASPPAHTTTSAPQSDPIRDTYLRVQAYVQQHPDTRRFFDPRPGDDYQGPNLLQDWAIMCDPTAVALNAFVDDYSRFSWAVNRQLGRQEFDLNPVISSGIIVETTQCPGSR